MREKFAEALARPLREVRFAVSEFAEESLLSRRAESCFFLDDSGMATIVPEGGAGREIPDSIFVTLTEKHIFLARFGNFAGEGAVPPDPEVWYRTQEGAGAVLEALFRSLCSLAAGSQAVEPLLRSICELVAERLKNEVEQRLSSEEQLWIRIRYRIDRCFREDLSREAMAAMLRIRPAMLSRMVRKFAGTGVCDYIRELRLGYAEELLMAREVIPIEEISRRCGFHSASYFISLFRRKYGVAPGVFRRRHLEL